MPEPTLKPEVESTVIINLTIIYLNSKVSNRIITESLYYIII